MKTHALLALTGTLLWASPSAAADASPGSPPPLPAASPAPAASPPAPPSPPEESGVRVEPSSPAKAPPYGVWTGPATYPTLPSSPVRDDSGLAVRHDPASPWMWRLELGYRANFVTNAGYNPFASQDYLGQLSIAATRTLFVSGPFVLASGLAWDYGRSSSTARGDPSSLEMQRLLVPIEGRVHFGRWGYALLRAAPGVAVENAEVDDAAVSAPFTKNRWLFAGDVSGGYAFPVVVRTGPSRSSPSMWLEADGGYGWAVAERLDLTAQTSASAAAVASGIDLGTLTMRGAFVRFSGAVAF